MYIDNPMFFAYDYGISKDRKSNSIFRNIA